ncbi:hypothetical protein CAL26_09900 [Bordetella genomosp. 9]|uniref:Uncharacterized protein n=1 Tax=Bordetella genomosp. 9 TaxID=1416803 RepID=A0A261RFD1_9BORD|nr:hypothetical protein [Bordetella genomosp. 9]OZI23734.1 hypothetical protein CAL26_09900 [Bordetella genomosp. 9]
MIDYTELLPTPLSVGACFDERTYLAELRRLRVEEAPEHWTGGAAAAVHFFEVSDGDTLAIMVLDAAGAASSGSDGIDIAALMCHEAVHVMQECRRWMNEKEPGKEWEAYTVQLVASRFMEAYARWVAR